MSGIKWLAISLAIIFSPNVNSVELERKTCFKDNFPMISTDNSDSCMTYVHRALYSNKNSSFVMKMSNLNVMPMIGSPHLAARKFHIGEMIQCEIIDNSAISTATTGSTTVTKTYVSGSLTAPTSGGASHTGSHSRDITVYTVNAVVPNYVYFPASPSGCFSFKVRAKNMVHISLSNAPFVQSPMYEIVLGQKGTFGFAAGTSIIRKDNKIGTNVAQVRTNPNILNDSEYSGFWIKWCATGLIEVGYEGEELPFMYYKDTSMFAVNYIGLMTHSCSGAWIIEEPKCPGVSGFGGNAIPNTFVHNNINNNINVHQPGVLDTVKSKFTSFTSGFGTAAPQAQYHSPPMAPMAPMATTTTTTSTSSMPSGVSTDIKAKCWLVPSIYTHSNFTSKTSVHSVETEFQKLMKVQEKLYERIEQKYKKFQNLPVPLQNNKRYLKDLMLDLNDDYQKAKELNDKLFYSTVEFEKEPVIVQKYFKDDRFSTINTMYFDLNNKMQTKIKQIVTEPDAEWHSQNLFIPDQSGRLVVNVDGKKPVHHAPAGGAGGGNVSVITTRTVIHFTPATVVNLQSHVLTDMQKEYEQFKKSDQHSKAYLKLLQQKLDEYIIKAKDRNNEIDIMRTDYDGDKNFAAYYKDDIYKQIHTVYNQFNMQLKKEYEKNANSNIEKWIESENNYTKEIETLYGDFKMEGKEWTKEELEGALKKIEGWFAELTKIHSQLLRSEITDEKEELLMKAYLERNGFFNAKVMFFAFYGGLQGAIEEKSGPIRVFKTIITPDDFSYKYFKAPESKNLTFKILAQNDAHILLTKGLGKSDAMFEIFLGEEYNTASSIRKNALKYVSQIKSPNILSAIEPKEFWITWFNGQIHVGHAGENKPFMSYVEKNMFPVNFIGIRTIDGSSGTWYFEDALVTITEYEINVKKTTIFQGKTEVVRG